MEPKFKSQAERLRAVFDVVYTLNGKQPISMDTVANWAIEKGLYPTPKRGCSKEEALAWERKLEAAK